MSVVVAKREHTETALVVHPADPQTQSAGLVDHSSTNPMILKVKVRTRHMDQISNPSWSRMVGVEHWGHVSVLHVRRSTDRQWVIGWGAGIAPRMAAQFMCLIPGTDPSRFEIASRLSDGRAGSEPQGKHGCSGLKGVDRNPTSVLGQKARRGLFPLRSGGHPISPSGRVRTRWGTEWGTGR